MTDPEFADATYVEPITPEIVEAIIAKERPDAVLRDPGRPDRPEHRDRAARGRGAGEVRRQLIGANVEAIQLGEDRQEFKGVVEGAAPSRPGRSSATRSTSAGRRRRTRLPGGRAPVVHHGRRSAPGFAYDETDLRRIAGAGLHAAPTTEVLLEESILGWKEYELELMRDHADNVVVVCSIENLDPMGVHTGDSITVAPALTLTDREYQRLRDIGIAVIREVGVDTGGCNIQFAVDPHDGRIIVIEMNPRVSRSSALASKATGFPIAKIAAKLAVGYTLDEMPNDITRETPASLRADARLRRRQGAAVRVREVPGRRPDADHDDEVGRRGDGDRPQLHRGAAEGAAVDGDARAPRSTGTADAAAPRASCSRGRVPTDGRIVTVQQAMRAGATVEQVHDGDRHRPVVPRPDGADQRGRRQVARRRSSRRRCCGRPSGTASATPRSASLRRMPEAVVRGVRHALGVRPVYKTVDTCAAEFAAHDALPLQHLRRGDRGARRASSRPSSSSAAGPNRIGQGVEFDYSCVHAGLRPARRGLRHGDGQLQPRDRLHRLRHVRPALLRAAHPRGRPRGGPRRAAGRAGRRRHRAARRADAARPRAGAQGRRRPDRRHQPRGHRPRRGPRRVRSRARRGRACRRPKHGTAYSAEEAVEVAQEIGYPVLVRPSYVLGGRGMEIVYDDETLADLRHPRDRWPAPSTRCSSTGSSTTRSRSTSTRSSTATEHVPRRGHGAHRGGRHPLRRLAPAPCRP